MEIVVQENLVHYETFGSKNKPPLLILHGWTGSLDEWLPIANHFSRNYYVLLLDLPGFGGSPNFVAKIADTYDYARLIEYFLNQLKINKVTLLGHSFGGKIAIILAKKPNLVKKLILIGPSGIRQKNLKTDLKIFLVKLFKPFKPIYHLCPVKIRDMINLFLLSRDYRNAGILLETFKNVVSLDTKTIASKIKVPTIIIWGEYDKELPLSNAKILKELINGSTLRIAWGMGHFPHLDKPEVFLNLLSEYL